MFLRRNRKKKRGESYEYWTLVETVRTAKGPRQRVIASIGKTPGMDAEEKIGWETILQDVHGKDRRSTFSEKEESIPDWATVDIRSLRVERIRQFGNVYLGFQLWKKLKLDEAFKSLQEKGREEFDSLLRS